MKTAKLNNANRKTTRQPSSQASITLFLFTRLTILKLYIFFILNTFQLFL